MLLHHQNLNKPTLLKYLLKYTCKVTFIKVKDQSTRTMLCTLDSTQLPAKFNKSVELTTQKESYDDDILPIWDITEGAWKSFRISKIVTFNIIDDKLDKTEGKVEKSKQQKLMEQKKIKAKKDFDKRVKNQKNKSTNKKEKEGDD